MALDPRALIAHSATLQKVSTLEEALDDAAVAVRQLGGFEHVWFGLFSDDRPGVAQIVSIRGVQAGPVRLEQTEYPIAGDAMMEEIARGLAPVVVVDARTDPRTKKEIVVAMGNRTIVNVPMRVGAQVVGTLGMGTFADEGLHPPPPEALEALTTYAMLLASALARVRVADRANRIERERDHLQRRLSSLQRIESVALLAAGVAHDFNNLLVVVQSGLTEVADAPLDEEQREALADAREAATRAQRLTSELLTLARSKRQVRPVELRERVTAVLELLRSSLPAGVRAELTPGPELRVEADPGQLDQVLANLVLNARDAIGAQGRIRLSVDARPVSAEEAALLKPPLPARWARLRVEDDGPGIPRELRERIFEPFFTTKEAGTGMGLAIVAQVVEQHRGMLRCETLPVGGAAFEVLLPS